MIDYASFTPGSALFGGLLIGLSAALLLLLKGRIMGVSGILGVLVDQSASDRSWRFVFILGTIVGAGVVFTANPALMEIQVSDSWVVLVIAGVLVGFGSRLGSGCTSGHGVCGIGRLSVRSIIATGIFMSAGIAAVAVGRHVLALI